MRNNSSPQFIHATCTHLEGHLLGDLLLRHNRDPGMMAETADSLKQYAGESLNEVLLLLRKIGGQTKKKGDPIVFIKKKLKDDADRLKQIEEEVTKDVEQIVNNALEISKGGMKNE